jgi:hypothetical protein
VLIQGVYLLSSRSASAGPGLRGPRLRIAYETGSRVLTRRCAEAAPQSRNTPLPVVWVSNS